MNTVNERDIESYLNARCKDKDWLCYKWTSPNIAGVPDRIIFPGLGKTFLVELKAPKKKLKPLQRVVHAKLKKLGLDVFVADSKERVDEIIGKIDAAS
jgi:hypothetical protein